MAKSSIKSKVKVDAKGIEIMKAVAEARENVIKRTRAAARAKTKANS